MADCKINVMMFGGRRYGKTSVIAAMSRNFKDVFGGKSDLEISTPDYDTMITLEAKQQEIDSFFLNKKYGEFSTDGPPSEGGLEYELDIFLKNRPRQDSITLTLYDFPGEWLMPDDREKGKQYHDLLTEKMKTCGIIMIAIDTPYLMEPMSDVLKSERGVGRWNEKRNYCQRISTMVKNSFTPDCGLEPKMILFVPLKCEKYYACGQMGIVSRKIQEAYKELLNYVNTGDARKSYEVVIAPILTFGENTVFFSRFQEDEDERPVDDEGNPLPAGLPAVSLFKFQNRAADYSPRFCEQPLLYALSYLLWHVSKAREREQKKRNLFERFIQMIGETFGNWVSAKDFLTQRQKILTHLKTSGDGYEILSDPLGLKQESH